MFSVRLNLLRQASKYIQTQFRFQLLKTIYSFFASYIPLFQIILSFNFLSSATVFRKRYTLHFNFCEAQVFVSSSASFTRLQILFLYNLRFQVKDRKLFVGYRFYCLQRDYVRIIATFSKVFDLFEIVFLRVKDRRVFSYKRSFAFRKFRSKVVSKTSEYVLRLFENEQNQRFTRIQFFVFDCFAKFKARV
ncbi:hypothetical protein LEP1GSC034_3826 [Leptospira interrogans str. 2003000735]|uniref:Transmembrane protein n=1 Tax=Leptospira interrogans str. 2002000626 TaxID=996803 RepID=A0A829D0R8_LEPIR|nr:hypothetical protein LEP1GSC027_2921 [Leptospira interrogans str. 2002000624]EKQ37677.1 hypothetical protein LEP1GSC025_0993 [Leptospira interrogans str. 2002000621]EKQ46386.1 hypothetical protein LEP1GSC026_1160 [Leptospira interrogans str. 2002000623]EMJ72603.1 hypothetical protein LEP1GSC034_3826 [Leptospira interrogans str. 2003000735]EMY04703.1 hypothetical protein LEP1GSC029_0327 [Leptospira interrogans str. 2002000626]